MNMREKIQEAIYASEDPESAVDENTELLEDIKRSRRPAPQTEDKGE